VKLTYVLIAINVVAYLWLISTGGLSSDRALLDHGALDGVACVQRGEWWRIVTGAFLHGGQAHIALNMIALLQLGTVVEEIYGKLRFGLVYAISLVGSGLAVVYASPNDITVGASGAIFGLFGALIAVGLRLGKRGRGLIMQMVPILALNLVFTFAVPNISKAGHVGGLIVGLLAGLVLFMRAAPGRTPVYAFAAHASPPERVETIEHPPDAGPHEEADAPPLEVRDPRE
jgi:rhomboid protease GluP